MGDNKNIIEYAVIYKNGRPERFFLKASNNKVFDFIQPYFWLTDIEHTRKGNILEMDCLFSGEVWQGRQRHGYGYSAAHDVFCTLIYDCILALYKNKLSEKSLNELKSINTHDKRHELSDDLLNELRVLNDEICAKKWAK